MASSDSNGARGREIAKYRLAAEEALGQLDWCIDYLHRIGKRRIAGALTKNRSVIRRRMRRPGDRDAGQS